MTPHIHRRSFGTGAHHILAIHCSLAHSGAWKGLAAALGASVTVQAFDLPCHGKSGDWDGRGDLHDTATAMARAVLDALGPDPVDVIGHSFGATVALRLAAETPDRLRRAALFEPVFFAPALAEDPDFARTFARNEAGHRRAFEAGQPEEAARLFNRAWAGPGTWAALPAKTRAYMAARYGFVYHSYPYLCEDSGGLLASGQLAEASLPVLLMRGAESPWAARINNAIARRLPQATEDLVTEAGHMAPVTHPEAVAARIRAFLD